MPAAELSLSETRAEVEKALQAVRESPFALEISEESAESVRILEAVIRLLDAGKMTPYEANASAAKVVSDVIHRLSESNLILSTMRGQTASPGTV